MEAKETVDDRGDPVDDLEALDEGTKGVENDDQD